MDAQPGPANRLDITNEFLALRGVLQLNQTSYAKLFGMSKQALSKLESAAGRAKMSLPSLVMISYISRAIIQSPYFRNLSEPQREKVKRLNAMCCEYLDINLPICEITDSTLKKM